ncbi:MAG: family 43 glycosylhydrolase, partial [Lachnospiraceae bacterium]|nr:family 43 glycosylhydrolase [Lachnospiraceae bacterium]
PWSEPYYLEDAAGIDPSLFFDEDGVCYYIGTHPNPKGCRYDGDCFIWIQELDLEAMKLTGEPRDVWNGAMRRVIWPEGPHLYKKDGWYYILHAEGGTGFHHAVTVCRSRSIWGPYENNPCNPILTHRHLGKDCKVQCVGHGDLVETAEGEWYMAHLAVRPTDGYTTLGRETFLTRVVWENGWPVVNPGMGRVTDQVEVGLEPWEPVHTVQEADRIYDFGRMSRLGDEFLFLRNPVPEKYSLCAGEGLTLAGGGCGLTQKLSPVYVGVRQRHHHFRADALISLPEAVQPGQEAGIALLQSNEYYLRVAFARENVGETAVRVYLCEKCEERLLDDRTVPVIGDGKTELGLGLEVRGLSAAVILAYGGQETELVRDVDIRSLSTETAGGFVGCTVGIYVTGDSDSSQGITFRTFSYQKLEL